MQRQQRARGADRPGERADVSEVVDAPDAVTARATSTGSAPSAIDQLPAVITWWSPVLAFSVSAAVGLFFGVVPARRAGRLDPVVALRTE